MVALPDSTDTNEYLSVCGEDLNLYFADTFLKLRVPQVDTPLWCYVSGFRSNSDSAFDDISVHVQPPAPHKSGWYMMDEVSFDFSFPSVGLYNYKKSVVFAARRTVRQNKKAVCDGTMHFYNVYELFRKFAPMSEKFLMSNMWRWNPKNLNTAFLWNQYFDLADAFASVKRLKDFARALSPDFYIGQGIDTPYPSLWFRKTLIGDVPDKKQIIIRNSAFFQEAKDFFLPKGIAINANV